MTMLAPDETRTIVAGEELLPRLLRDLLAVDNVEPRRGHRAATKGRAVTVDGLDADQGRRLLDQLRGQDFTTLPFAEAFRCLAGDRGLTNLARRTGLSRSNLSRLLNGKPPKPEEMEAVAAAFGKRAIYFAEYRETAILRWAAERLAADPDRSAVLAHQLGLGR